MSLAVGEPQRVAHTQPVLSLGCAVLSVGQQITAKSMTILDHNIQSYRVGGRRFDDATAILTFWLISTTIGGTGIGNQILLQDCSNAASSIIVAASLRVSLRDQHNASLCMTF